MKSRYYPLLFALVQIPFVLFLGVVGYRARAESRWNEKEIPSATYRQEVVPTTAPRPSQKELEFERHLRRVAQNAGFQLRAVSPDGSRLLVEGEYHMAVLLDGRDGRIVANLIKIWNCNWDNEQFSPDSRVVTFTQIRSDTTLRQLHSVASGEQLWSDTHTRADILFSPDGKYLAYKTLLSFQPDTFTVRETLTGRDTSLRPRMGLRGQGHFSRDSRSFLVETADGQNIRYPLRPKVLTDAE